MQEDEDFLNELEKEMLELSETEKRLRREVTTCLCDAY